MHDFEFKNRKMDLIIASATMNITKIDKKQEFGSN